MKLLNLIIIFLLIFFSESTASNKDSIVNQLNKINNISFNFIQTIGDKEEKGNCIIKYPKKIFCEYKKKKNRNKVLVSNGSSLVIKNNKQYYRYPLKSTPFELLLDKDFIINKIRLSKLKKIDNKYFFFQIIEKNSNINIFFSKKNFGLIGWQVEDAYQNLAMTFIYDKKINKIINENLFKLPKQY